MVDEAKPVAGGGDTDLAYPAPAAPGGIRLRIFADLSAAHLTEDLAQWLEEECQRRSWSEATEGMPSVWNLGTGFFIWIPDPEFDHPDFDRVVDPILKRIFEVARQAGADYLLLDRDADTCDAFPVSNW